MKLVMFSGGADSTLLVKNILELGESVVMYHLILKTPANRWKEENKACLDIRDYFMKKYPNKITYKEAIIDISQNRQNLDSNFAIFFGAMLADYNENISEVQIGYIKEDTVHNVNMPDYYNKEKAFQANLRMRDDVKLTYPLENTSKKEVINLLGSLLNIIYYCRYPKQDNGEGCGFCHTCKDINKAKKELGID